MTGTADPVVDIALACYNGEAFVGALLESIQSQTHGNWRVSVRDDGSSDGTLLILKQFSANDSRIQILHAGGPALGATGAFGWIMDHLPPDAAYIMFADQDDVWKPEKIALLLAVVRAAELQERGPVLAHSDLVVVDDNLREIHPSFWKYSRISPEPATLRRLVIQNVVTGAATLFNRALLDRAAPLPTDAQFHDWWLALVASAFGRVITVNWPLVLYRQHADNAVGARRRGGLSPSESIRAVVEGLGRGKVFRTELAKSSRQAAAFLSVFESHLTKNDREFVQAFARIPTRGLLLRKLDVMRLRLRREDGVLRNIGALLRA